MVKLLIDGYFDMRKYVKGKTDRLELYVKLKNSKSRFADLFKNEYPQTYDEIMNLWHSVSENHESFNDNYVNAIDLSTDEADAIVYWVYQVDKEKRKLITSYIFSNEKALHGINCTVDDEHGITYNSEKIEIKLINNISEFNSLIATKNISTRLFYRGHSNANYLLLLSLFRAQNLLKNERKMYNELLIECPHYFPYGSTHLDKLVEMQHYGLPTRLLDITSNPLVALYFACETNPDSLGEIILISTDEDSIKYPNSDCVSLLASLPLFSYKDQLSFLTAAQTLTKAQFNKQISRLLHEVKQEKPSFMPIVNNADLLNNYKQNRNTKLFEICRKTKVEHQFLCGLCQSLRVSKFRYERA